MAALAVKNVGSHDIQISVNKWKADNDSDWHTLVVVGKKDHHDYDRNDARGFLLAVMRPSSNNEFTTFQIKDRGLVSVSDTGADQDGVALQPLISGIWS